jgi:hypothetical protein
MATGPRDTTSLVMLTGWDATALKNYQLQDGTTYAAIYSALNSALGAVNGEIANDPVYSSLVSYTDQLELEYRVGASNAMQRFTEYGRPDAQRAATEGHMLPLVAFDNALGWTWDYMRKARMSQVEADIADAAKNIRDNFRQSVLGRILKRGDDSGVANGLGAGGYSPGFATTAAQTSVDFVPPANGGNVFTNTHEHYNTIDGGLFTNAVFTDSRSELLEHGHNPPYEYMVGTTDAATVVALTDFVPARKELIMYSSAVDLATFGAQYGMNGIYSIGTISEFRVWVVPGMPRYYGFGWKSYGANSQKNPLRVRLQKGQQRFTATAFPDPRAGAGAAFPLQEMIYFAEYGVGVADRTAGAPYYVNHANTWTDGAAA